MPEVLSLAKTPKAQAIATLNQAAPVQNTWYTILSEQKNCRLIGFGASVAVADETLEIRLTVDGVVFSTVALACTAGTVYYGYLSQNNVAQICGLSATEYTSFKTFIIEGRTVKLEIRKTTALGAGTLTAAVCYQLW